MKLAAIAFAFSLVLAQPLAAEEKPLLLCEPWETEYAEADASAAHVVGLWQFAPGAEVADASGRQLPGSLHGAVIHPEGRFGACLESFAGWPVEDKRRAAVVANHPSLSPKGAFTLEMWIKPKPELSDDYPDAFLIDKKYVAHDDYQLVLGPADRSGTRVVRVSLGFGIDSSTWYSRPARFEPGAWRHLAFTYDGVGTGSFTLDGLPWGSQLIPGRKGISPGRHPLSIGDRIGSYYHGFPGFLDQVRLCEGVREFRRVKFERISDRACFVRNEPNTVIRFRATNLQRIPLAAATATLSLDGMAAQEVAIDGLASGQSREIDYPVPTNLRPDQYRLLAALRVKEPSPLESEETFPVRIVPRRPPRMPVLMWGGYSDDPEQLAQLKRIGFTHALGIHVDYGKIRDAKAPTEAGQPEAVAQAKNMLDDALAADLGIAASLSPGSTLRGKPEFSRINRQGKPYEKDICALAPELEPFCENVGASVAQTYGRFPAFSAALLHTEVRDAAQPCFHPWDHEAFRKFAGYDIPAEVGGRGGVDYTRLADFPADRVIADEHPLYVYYRWYWKQGDGWNGLNTALHKGLKSTGRTDLWTFHDPAARVASAYGSGGEVDYLSQWTYSYPDPIRIGVATDELLAMAGG